MYRLALESCHVEDVTHGHATPVDTAVSLKLSAIEVIGRETDQGGDLMRDLRMANTTAIAVADAPCGSTT